MLFEQVADHAFALGAEHVERVGCCVVKRLALQREQPDLVPVTVRDDELVVARELGDRRNGDGDVGALSRLVVPLATAHLRVAAEGDDYPHELTAVRTGAGHEPVSSVCCRDVTAGAGGCVRLESGCAG